MPHKHALGAGESLQVPARTVALVLVGILAMLAAVGFGLTLFFPNRIGMDHAVVHRFPSPAVIPDERTVRLRLEARQRRELAGGAGRMPIQQAMQAVVARGDHAFDPAAP
ncbi:MAG TPA: hypothetical protein VHZ32_12635 [Rhizomicrobium sp.]|jgi:hypothetical protein|nr:hypothetical protein [Rhizomicrobium sp.]